MKLFDGFGNPEFKLRIRTPCEKPAGKYEYPENCAGWLERVQLWPMPDDEQDSRDVKKDKVLMHWIISDFGGQGESLMARDGRDNLGIRPELKNSWDDVKKKSLQIPAATAKLPARPALQNLHQLALHYSPASLQ